MNPKTLPSTNIIVIRYKQPDLELLCLDSVRRMTFAPYRLTNHNNDPKNEPLSVLWNRYIEEQTEPYFCLLNSDTRVEPHWLTKLIKAIDSDKTAGAIGPCTDNCAGVQRSPKSQGVVIPPHLVGFCLVGRKEAWEQVGGFDEKSPFYGQDTDYIRRIVNAGWTLLWHRGVFVHHEHGGTAHRVFKGSEYQHQRQLGKEYIRKK